MEFEPPLEPGRLVKRYKRFLSDITLDTGETITAHCANPGAMTGLNEPGLRVWVQPATNPARKLRYSWRLVERADGAFAGIDTSVPNRIVGEALEAGTIPEFARYSTIRPEQKYGTNSRVDFLLSDEHCADLYLEVKNVHLMRTSRLAEFPDCVTDRGTKHLNELAEMARQGNRAVMLYVIQMTNVDAFRLASDIDPVYAAAFARAKSAGVEAMAIDTEITPDGIRLRNPVPILDATGSGVEKPGTSD